MHSLLLRGPQQIQNAPLVLLRSNFVSQVLQPRGNACTPRPHLKVYSVQSLHCVRTLHMQRTQGLEWAV